MVCRRLRRTRVPSHNFSNTSARSRLFHNCKLANGPSSVKNRWKIEREGTLIIFRLARLMATVNQPELSLHAELRSIRESRLQA